jgi:DNA processing protein
VSDAEAILALMLAPGVGRVAVHSAISAAAQMDVPMACLMRRPAAQLAAIAPVLAGHGPGCQEQAAALFQDAREQGLVTLTSTEAGYPEALTAALATQAPPLLFLSGNCTLLGAPMCAVVGARVATRQGKRLARACATALAGAGVTVVSGGADGIDSAAHTAALRSGGQTVVVLPQGLLTFPRRRFAAALESGSVLLLSEFRPDLPWETFAAVTRNATISALAGMVCVTEPKKTGGSIRTARVALDQGKRVLVYCQDAFRSVGESLCQAGAMRLPVKGQALDVDAFLDLWRTAPSPVTAQQDLFRE